MKHSCCAALITGAEAEKKSLETVLTLASESPKPAPTENTLVSKGWKVP